MVEACPSTRHRCVKSWVISIWWCAPRRCRRSPASTVFNRWNLLKGSNTSPREIVGRPLPNRDISDFRLVSGSSCQLVVTC